MDLLKPRLVSLLRCPSCIGRLTLHAKTEEKGEITEGRLACAKCNVVYPIVRGIPRFVPNDQYVHSFSFQWNLFAQTQLDKTKKLDVDNYTTFEERTGFRGDDLEHKLVLEAGCGMGRFIDVVANVESAEVVGFDLSLAVESAFANVGSRPNVHILQADILQPPLAQETFDIVYSIGVLHHTPSPSASFLRLVSLLKRGGNIAIWVYPKYEWAMLSDVYRQVTTRLPWSMLLGVVKVMTTLHAIDDKMPRFLHHCADLLLPVSGQSDPESKILGTYDWYSPKYQFKSTNQTILSWFRHAGLVDVTFLEFPGAVRGRR